MLPGEWLVFGGSFVDDIEPDDWDRSHDASPNKDWAEGGEEQESAFEPENKFNK